MQELSELIESAQREFAEANAAAALEDAKARYLGKTGSLTTVSYTHLTLPTILLV